ncbi:MAG: hypothetical protein KME42_21695 [Tildeniella nuda ZEHNDER 1965/U140]|jgi:hypothetical protein|nr:hypothetical protein [Tildeniella nuda ZEHNDER 1965/U140]
MMSEASIQRLRTVRPSAQPSLDGTPLLPEETLNQPESHLTEVAEEQSDETNRSPRSSGVERSHAHNIISLPDQAAKSRIPWWLNVSTLVSLGLHGLLLFLPMGHESTKPPKPQEKQVRITQLPTLTKVAPVKTLPKPRVTPRVVSDRPTTPPLKRAVAPPPSQPAPGSPNANSWADFPLYPNSQPGCFGLPSCLQVDDALSQVTAFFARELPAKKYDLKPTLKEAGREIYQVSRGGQTQFLSVITSEKGTVYVLSDAPRSLEDLKKAVEVPPEVSDILSNLDAKTAEPSLFAQPDLFYTRSTEKGLGAGAQVPRSGIRNISLVPDQVAADMMNAFFQTNLQNSGYEVTDRQQQYGGGNVYQVKKPTVTLYLNLVPTKDKSGTLVVTWKDAPR